MSEIREGSLAEFMVAMMACTDEVVQAMIIYRLNDGTITYNQFNQTPADGSGMVRRVQLCLDKDMMDEIVIDENR